MTSTLSTEQRVDVADLVQYEPPPATNTYCPVAHADMATTIMNVSTDILGPKGYIMKDASCGIAKEGARVFGIFAYANGDAEVGLSIGWRNSYDKSMSAGLAIGASVYVCSNLMLTGEITIMRKHTKNIGTELTDRMITGIYRSIGNYDKLLEARTHLKEIPFDLDDGYRMIGLLAGREILTPTIANEAMREWRHPQHDCFPPNNAWSCYNSVTHALKKSPPHKVMENHIAAHGVFAQMIPGSN